MRRQNLYAPREYPDSLVQMLRYGNTCADVPRTTLWEWWVRSACGTQHADLVNDSELFQYFPWQEGCQPGHSLRSNRYPCVLIAGTGLRMRQDVTFDVRRYKGEDLHIALLVRECLSRGLEVVRFYHAPRAEDFWQIFFGDRRLYLDDSDIVMPNLIVGVGEMHADQWYGGAMFNPVRRLREIGEEVGIPVVSLGRERVRA